MPQLPKAAPWKIVEENGSNVCRITPLFDAQQRDLQLAMAIHQGLQTFWGTETTRTGNLYFQVGNYPDRKAVATALLRNDGTDFAAGVLFGALAGAETSLIAPVPLPRNYRPEDFPVPVTPNYGFKRLQGENVGDRVFAPRVRNSQCLIGLKQTLARIITEFDRDRAATRLVLVVGQEPQAFALEKSALAPYTQEFIHGLLHDCTSGIAPCIDHAMTDIVARPPVRRVPRQARGGFWAAVAGLLTAPKPTLPVSSAPAPARRS